MADCVDCNYMDLKDRNRYDEAYCAYMKKYTTLTGSCYHFDRRESGSSCYLTTAMCEILGYEDNSDILENLRGFRDFYMWNDPKCEGLLDEYNTIGPIVSKKLKNDEDSISTALMMRDEYIIPAISFIFEERYEEALTTYIDMTNMLKAKYNVGVRNTIYQTMDNKYKCKTKRTLVKS